VRLARDLAVAEASAGRFEKAEALLEEAETRFGALAEATAELAKDYGALARVALKKENREVAQRAARHGLQLDPQAPVPYAVLGQIAYLRNDAPEAVRLWEIGLSRNPKDHELTGLLARAERERKVEGAFTGVSTAHFNITFDGGADDALARLAGSMLEDAWRDVGKMFDRFPTEPVGVILYPKESFRSLDGPAWSAGLFDGKVRVPSKDGSNYPQKFKATLYHEYAHALAHQLSGGRPIPAWLNEGLAQVAADQVDRAAR